MKAYSACCNHRFPGCEVSDTQPVTGSAKKEGFDTKTVSGVIVLADEYPDCPHCGAGGFLQCGDCGRVSYYRGGQESSICPFCRIEMKSFTGAYGFDEIKGGELKCHKEGDDMSWEL